MIKTQVKNGKVLLFLQQKRLENIPMADFYF